MITYEEILATGLPLSDHGAIAEALSVNRTELKSTPIGVGTVLDTLGPVDGAAVLDALESLKASVSAIKWAFILLERGELDVGMLSVRGQIDALTGTVFSAEQAKKLKDLAVQKLTVSPVDVQRVIDGAV